VPHSRRPVVIITGVSSGIGLATAKLFAQAGWVVVGTVRGRGRRAMLGLTVDLQPAEMSQAGDLSRIVQYTVTTYGRVDVLVCNAGYALLGPADSVDYNQIRDQFLINTVAPAELSRLVIPVMKKQNRGTIVYLSSIVGRTGLAGFSMYSASKWALEGLAESLADELVDNNIRIRLIEPSGVNTAFWSSLKRGKSRNWHNGEIGRVAADSQRGGHGLSAEQVAHEVYLAATDTSERLRYPLGQTRMMGLAKRILPDRLFRLGLRRTLR
jgi:NAD(P)-dependent dehydrogenase (short-subunit alcohol dehydrogenase family)